MLPAWCNYPGDGNILQVGYLYLTDVNRLEEVMCKLGFSTDASTQLGFSTDASTQLGLQETDSKLTLAYV